MPEVHAKLSASGAKRWIACTPSVTLEEQYEDKGSTYAAEGTFAHSLAELILRYNNGEMTKRKFNADLKKLQENEYWNKELQEYVEGYANTVWEFANEAKAKCKDAEILFEQKLDFSAWVPEGFGTGDVVIIADGQVHVIDLKYGKGVGVSAEENPQLRLYGLGAVDTYGMLYDIDSVKMTIIQPRLDNISSEELAVENLVEWAEEVVKPAAELAMNGEGEFVAGDHCKFCKARATCRARAEKNLELIKYEFKKPETLTPSEIGEILKQADELVAWIGDVQEYALDAALSKEIKFDGWKVVEGRSNRKYTDELEVANALKAAGYDEAILYAPRKLYGITDMEKSIGKKAFAEHLKDLIIKPEGKPTLVPENDKRPELKSADSAAKDFEDDLLA